MMYEVRASMSITIETNTEEEALAEAEQMMKEETHPVFDYEIVDKYESL